MNLDYLGLLIAFGILLAAYLLLVWCHEETKRQAEKLLVTLETANQTNLKSIKLNSDLVREVARLQLDLAMAKGALGKAGRS